MRRVLTGLAFAVVSSGAVGCGARTGLIVDPPVDASAPVDAGVDVSDEPALDAGRDASVEDAGHERDAEIEDAGHDVPTIDAAKDVTVVDECPDAGSTLVYVVTETNQLLSFYPPLATFRTIGTIACPAAAGATPFSMAVERAGTAYVLFSDGELFRVSTADASCRPTSFVAGQSAFSQFGMGFAADVAGGGETLFIGGTTTSSLGTIDTTTMKVSPIAPFDPPLDGPELTGTSDGRLYGFYVRAGQPGTFIGEIDKRTAKLVAEDALPNLDRGQAWAFAAWGGDFWLFVAPGSTSEVHRLETATGKLSVVTGLGSRIVGAGVSTCAP